MFTREFTNSVFGTRDQVASCDNALFCIYAELLKPFRYSWPFPLEHVVNREILKDAKLSIYLDASSFFRNERTLVQTPIIECYIHLILIKEVEDYFHSFSRTQLDTSLANNCSLGNQFAKDTGDKDFSGTS